jgi:hypothetical protein
VINEIAALSRDVPCYVNEEVRESPIGVAICTWHGMW